MTSGLETEQALYYSFWDPHGAVILDIIIIHFIHSRLKSYEIELREKSRCNHCARMLPLRQLVQHTKQVDAREQISPAIQHTVSRLLSTDITINQSSITTTTTTTILRPFVRDYPGEPVPEETLTHPPSWSSSNLYQLLPSTTIHSILLVQITCLAIFLHNLLINQLINQICTAPHFLSLYF